MKITVVIPLYNKRDTVVRALGSVFNQTFQPDEIIVVNDGSTDGSEKVVKELNHPLVKIIHQTNRGVSAARNRGISEAGCAWIAFLDADDEWMPGFLETIKSLSQEFPQCQVLATSYFLHDLQGERRNIILRRLPFTGNHGLLTNYFEVAAHSNPPFCSISVAVKKDILQGVGGFPEDIYSGEDLVTWARLACRAEIAYSVTPLAVYRLNPPTIIDRRKGSLTQPDKVPGYLNVLKRNCPGQKRSHLRQFIGSWHKMRASIFMNVKNDRSNALKEIIKSISAYPFSLKIYLYPVLIILPGRLRKRIIRFKSKTK